MKKLAKAHHFILLILFFVSMFNVGVIPYAILATLIAIHWYMIWGK